MAYGRQPLPLAALPGSHLLGLCQGHRPAGHPVQDRRLPRSAPPGAVRPLLGHAHHERPALRRGVLPRRLPALCHPKEKGEPRDRSLHGHHDRHHGVALGLGTHQGLRMLRRRHPPHQRRDAAEEPPAARHGCGCGVETVLHGALHLEDQPVDRHQLHAALHPRLLGPEPLVSAALRLPPLPYRSRHPQGNGDPRRSQAAEV